MRFGIILTLLLFLGLLLFGRWYYACEVCNERNYCGRALVQPVDEDIRASTLNLMDNGKIALKGYQEFKVDSAVALPILNENNNDFLAAVAEFMKKNPQKKLIITGQLKNSEKDISAGMFENLGVARANEIRKKLVAEYGLSEDRINLDYEFIADDASLETPLRFSATGPDGELADNNANDGGNDGEGTPDEFESEGQAFTFTNMTFSDANFDYDSDVFKPGSAFINYADSVKTYLSTNDGKSLTLTGHTCDLGADKYNLDLGRRRAKSVKKYFQNLGVTATINTDSKGETQPAYRNTSDANRSKNRRVNIQIK